MFYEDPYQKLLKKCADLSVLLNMIINYATVGRVKDFEKYDYRTLAKIIDEEQEKKYISKK
jgi:hypothetical protein